MDDVNQSAHVTKEKFSHDVNSTRLDDNEDIYNEM